MTAGVELPHRAIREQISSAFDLLVQIREARRRLAPRHARDRGAADGVRRDHAAGTSSSRGRPTRSRPSTAARASSRPCGTGLKPHFLEKMAASGVILPPNFFKSEARPASPHLRLGWLRERAVRFAFVILAALALAVPASAANRPTAVDVTGYPEVRATLVTGTPLAKPPKLTENGRPVAGLGRENLGREKSVVARRAPARCWAGRSEPQARLPARSWPPSRARTGSPSSTFGSSAVQATGFSTGTFEARSALSSLAVDRVQGHGSLRRGEARRAGARRRHDRRRVLVLLTDGDDVSSDQLASAISAAREAEVTVYPIGLESKSFDPPRCAAWRSRRRRTGRRRRPPRRRLRLARRGLRRTWLSYLTSVRPGDGSSSRRPVPALNRSHRAWRAPGRRSRRCPAGSSTSARSRSP